MRLHASSQPCSPAGIFDPAALNPHVRKLLADVTDLRTEFVQLSSELTKLKHLATGHAREIEGLWGENSNLAASNNKVSVELDSTRKDVHAKLGELRTTLASEVLDELTRTRKDIHTKLGKLRTSLASEVTGAMAVQLKEEVVRAIAADPRKDPGAKDEAGAKLDEVRASLKHELTEAIAGTLREEVAQAIALQAAPVLDSERAAIVTVEPCREVQAKLDELRVSLQHEVTEAVATSLREEVAQAVALQAASEQPHDGEHAARTAAESSEEDGCTDALARVETRLSAAEQVLSRLHREVIGGELPGAGATADAGDSVERRLCTIEEAASRLVYEVIGRAPVLTPR